MVEHFVPGMHCMFCRYRLKSAIRKINPNLEVKIDLRTGLVRVRNQEDFRTVERSLAYLDDLARSS